MPEVIPEKGTEVAGTVLVQVGATPAPAEVKNCPVLPAVEFGIKAAENCRFPTTSSFCPGPVVPIPTLPLIYVLWAIMPLATKLWVFSTSIS